MNTNLKRKLLSTILLVALLVPAESALAKGNFSYLTISGEGIKGEVQVTDPGLTGDFFAFADFSGHALKAPAEPGPGFEVTRWYMDAGQPSAFDRLHYYPAAGLVYYDGIVNGDSEYDDKWYVARPGIRDAFTKALPASVTMPALKAAPLQSPDLTPFIAVAGLAVVLALALSAAYLFRRRAQHPA